MDPHGTYALDEWYLGVTAWHSRICPCTKPWEHLYPDQHRAALKKCYPGGAEGTDAGGTDGDGEPTAEELLAAVESVTADTAASGSCTAEEKTFGTGTPQR